MASATAPWPRWLRFTLVASATLILCSCRGVTTPIESAVSGQAAAEVDGIPVEPVEIPVAAFSREVPLDGAEQLGLDESPATLGTLDVDESNRPLSGLPGSAAAEPLAERLARLAARPAAAPVATPSRFAAERTTAKSVELLDGGLAVPHTTTTETSAAPLDGSTQGPRRAAAELPLEGLPVEGLPVEGLPLDGSPVEGLPMEGTTLGLPPHASDSILSPADCGPEPTAACPCCPAPLPQRAAEPWRPPGIAGPWPSDEYVCDGGDYTSQARVRGDWSVAGLDSQDTLAHYDTLDGRAIVQPSNRVCIYAPRFAAVRHIDSLGAHQSHARVAEFENPLKPNLHAETQPVANSTQPLQPIGALATRAASTYRGREQGGGIVSRRMVADLSGDILPHEDLQIMQRGEFAQSQKARLVEHVQAALVWTRKESVQVVIEGRPALALTLATRPETVYRFDDDSSPELRIVKTASALSARPGETIDFTLRYDNTGSQPIGNVVILDNLSPRLEYVEESAQSSLKAELVTEPNQEGSVVLRWELAEPLEPGQGGLIRFRCLVR